MNRNFAIDDIQVFNIEKDILEFDEVKKFLNACDIPVLSADGKLRCLTSILDDVVKIRHLFRDPIRNRRLTEVVQSLSYAIENKNLWDAETTNCCNDESSELDIFLSKFKIK